MALDRALLTYLSCFLALQLRRRLFYLPLFVLGALIASRFQQIRSWISAFTGRAENLWLFGSLLLYSVDSVLESLRCEGTKASFCLYQISGLGAAGIILGVSSFAGVASVLNSGVFQFLGRTSYSFYLVHFVFILAITPVLYRRPVRSCYPGSSASCGLCDCRYLIPLGGEAGHALGIVCGSVFGS